MSALVQQILARTGDKSLVKYGTVESLAGGLAAVRVGGSVVEGCTWRHSCRRASGLALGSVDPADYFISGSQYWMPENQYDIGDNLALLVSYVTPIDEDTGA